VILEFLARSTLIAASAALVLFALRIRAAAAQHAVWTGVLAAMLALPLWMAWGPKAAVPVLKPEPATAFATAPAAILLPLPSTSAPPASTPMPRPVHCDWTAAGIAVYLLGAATLLLRLAIGTIRAQRLTSASCAAPITVGLLRPRVILPAYAETWTPAQLDAVLVHERAHVRRRDPLVQWLALLNRAIFWFHPLSWWLERRLTALAEEACDAAVLDSGHAPAEYSAYLIDLARAVQRTGGRVTVTGMAMPGSDLPRRIRRIVAGVVTPRVSRAQLVTASLATVICTATFAAATLEHASDPPQPRPKFDVASIRPCKESDITQGAGKKGGRGGGGRVRTSPGSLVGECQPVAELIRWAYLGYPDGKPWPSGGVTGFPMQPLPNRIFRQEIKGPGWISSDRYTIEAKAEGAPSMEMMRGPMMQTLLEDRFRLQLRLETRDIPAYFLTVAAGGPKLQPSKEGSCISMVEFDERFGPGPRKPDAPVPHVCGPFRPSIYNRDPNTDRAVAVRSIGVDTWGQEMAMLCLQFSVGTEGIVVDRTGLTGRYDIHLELATEDLFGGGPPNSDATEPPPTPEQKIAHIAAAVQKLGLKLEPGKMPAKFVVIDRVERPTAN
jgi:bla regulator protein blaR1